MRLSNISRRKIGLALGGGGARGLAHIGVLKVFAREGIPIDVVAGTSMGGIIGAALAAGASISDMETEALKVRRRREQIKLVDPKLSGSGLLKGSRVYQYLSSLLGEELIFADLNLPLAMVAVDFNTGREVILKEGNVVDAIRATISVPGIFAPFVRDKQLLVDGGVLNNVPVDVARELGAQTVIAVDVLPNFPQDRPEEPLAATPVNIPGVTQSLVEIMHVQMIMISEMTELKLKTTPSDVLIRPASPSRIGLFAGFEHAEEAIAAGEAAAEEALPKIRELLSVA